MIAIQYKYHDAGLVTATSGPRREASLVFKLCPIIYSEPPTVTLRFGGVFNDHSVSRFIASINNDAIGEDAYLARCDTIQIDTKVPSKDGDIFVFVGLDYFGEIQIHCQHLTELKA
ncbi:hypothetical protein CA54_27650 [Symmachiella macrocystis]|uniref:Uncharacterized protein n=1 Tax=Symmachiella macrocystis TaxID=2527985 RepID=A0A5C6BP07_9PLAN|nr:hypothetical protein [Symmachiella macrocystis]TWU13923.1 hypothetical protein CA54_27650 [Symmachiella macrocystis]